MQTLKHALGVDGTGSQGCSNFALVYTGMLEVANMSRRTLELHVIQQISA